MTILELWNLIKKHSKLVIALPVVFALAMAFYSVVFMPNQYTAETSVYVLTKAPADNGQAGFTSSDLTASQMLTNDIAGLFTSNRVEGETAKSLGLENLENYKVTVENTTTTRSIVLKVTGVNPTDATRVANELVKTTSSVAHEVMNIESLNVINKAQEPEKPSGPSRVKYTALAFFAGLIVSIIIVVLGDIADTRVRSAEEASELVKLPIIGRIPTVKGK